MPRSRRVLSVLISILIVLSLVTVSVGVIEFGGSPVGVAQAHSSAGDPQHQVDYNIDGERFPSVFVVESGDQITHSDEVDFSGKTIKNYTFHTNFDSGQKGDGESDRAGIRWIFKDGDGNTVAALRWSDDLNPDNNKEDLTIKAYNSSGVWVARSNTSWGDVFGDYHIEIRQNETHIWASHSGASVAKTAAIEYGPSSDLSNVKNITLQDIIWDCANNDIINATSSGQVIERCRDSDGTNDGRLRIYGYNTTGTAFPAPKNTVSGTVQNQHGDPDLYEKTFELDSRTDLFNPQTTTLNAYYWATDEGDRALTGHVARPGDVEVGTRWKFEDADQFDFREQATVQLHDGSLYKLVLIGTYGDKYELIGYSAAKSDSDEIYVIGPICGPSGCDDDQTPTPPGTVIGDPPPPPTPFVPTTPGGGRNDMGPIAGDTFLDTGVFLMEEGRCVGLRYWDPSRETTELTYDFNVSGTRYHDTILFDEPVGYYTTCIEELAFGPSNTTITDPTGNVTLNFTKGGQAFNTSVDFGGIPGFTGGQENGGIGVPFQPDEGGANPLGNPWLIAIVLAVAGYYFRDDLQPLAQRLGPRIVMIAQQASSALTRLLTRFRP